MYRLIRYKNEEFQSTHSVGSGTDCTIGLSVRYVHFNPPTPWGVGPDTVNHSERQCHFNPPTPWGVGQQNCTKKYAIFIQSKQCYRFGLRFVRV